MKVIAYAADEGGCGFYRMREPGRVLAAAGHDVTVVRAGGEENMEVSILLGRVVELTSIPDCDAVVVQRPLHWTRAKIIPQLQKAGVKVFCEIDDDVRAVQQSHAAYQGMHPRHSTLHNWEWCRIAMELADRVIVSTSALGEAYGAGRTLGSDLFVVPNYLPEAFLIAQDRLHVTADPERVVVGWPGKVSSHPDDLTATRQGVGRLQRVLRFPFKVIGSPSEVRRQLALVGEPFAHPWVPYEAYPAALSTLDVAIAPLGAHVFNESKSWLKPLELAGRGVPFVASPSPEYARFAALGAGILAEGRQEWMSALRSLVTDPALRTEQARIGLKVARSLVIEDHVDEWARAWGFA